MFRSAAKTAAVCTNKSTMKIDKGANVMAEQSMGPRDFFRKEAAIADLAPVSYTHLTLPKWPLSNWSDRQIA